MNCSTILYQDAWGVHFNWEDHFTSPSAFPTWPTPLQQRDWQCRGIVVWNAGLHVVAHFYAGYALEILEQMRAKDAWQSEGFLIGSPSNQLSSESVDGV